MTNRTVNTSVLFRDPVLLILVLFLSFTNLRVCSDIHLMFLCSFSCMDSLTASCITSTRLCAFPSMLEKVAVSHFSRPFVIASLYLLHMVSFFSVLIYLHSCSCLFANLVSISFMLQRTRLSSDAMSAHWKLLQSHCCVPSLVNKCQVDHIFVVSVGTCPGPLCLHAFYLNLELQMNRFCSSSGFKICPHFCFFPWIHNSSFPYKIVLSNLAFQSPIIILMSFLWIFVMAFSSFP